MKAFLKSQLFTLLLLAFFAQPSFATIPAREAINVATTYLLAIDRDIENKIVLDLPTSLSRYQFDGRRYTFYVQANFSAFCSIKINVFADTGTIDLENSDRNWWCHAG